MNLTNDKINQLGSDRLASRQIDELIGICRGISADGELNFAEAEYIAGWLAANKAICDQPLINTLYSRIAAALADGILDEDEQKDLLDTMKGLTGNPFELGEAMTSAGLPLTDPAPTLDFDAKHFTFTGTFVFGQRKHCEAAVVELGATAGSLVGKTDVLVVGAYATDSWKHSSFGNKILKAVDMQSKGHGIVIVSEQHWTSFLTK